MTNREYFETNEISFNEAMKEFNEKKFKSFDDFLNSERITYKFKAGDIIVMDCKKQRAWENRWCNNVVFKVRDRVMCGNVYDYELEFLTPTPSNPIGKVRDDFSVGFIDEVCELY